MPAADRLDTLRQIESALAGFGSLPLADASFGLLKILG
jgi:hypothetical protein